LNKPEDRSYLHVNFRVESSVNVDCTFASRSADRADLPVGEELLKPGWMTVISTRCHGGFAGHRFFRFRVRRDSKAVRFNDHLPKIRNEHIHLPEFAIRREELVAEIVAFRGEFDDQIDAMTLDLDFIDTDLTIPRSRKRKPLSVVNASPAASTLNSTTHGGAHQRATAAVRSIMYSSEAVIPFWIPQSENFVIQLAR